MSDASAKDPIVDALGRELRERERVRHEAWEPVLLGRRSADEVARERAEAGDTAEEIELARALFQPIAAVDHDRAIEVMAANAGGGRGRRWWWAPALLAVAAAIVLLWWYRPAGPENGPSPLALASLPAFELSTDDGLATVRGATVRGATVRGATVRGATEVGDELRYRSSNTFDWRLRPEVEVESRVDLRLCARSERGEIVVVDPAPILEQAESGAMRLRGPISALGLTPGRWTLTLIMGDARALAVVVPCAVTNETAFIRVERLSLILD
jgi:hypothetical protein